MLVDTIGPSPGTWSMAVGGMVGGGIFSVLGVVASVAGPLAWMSFVVAGTIALATADSYARLAATFREPGGSFAFLRRTGHPSIAANLAWVLIIGYVLTMSVYAFTFGHYLGEVAGLGALSLRLLGVALVAALVIVNLVGVGGSAGVEIVTVWGKLVVLLGLAAFGLVAWDPTALGEGLEGDMGPFGVVVGAASIFMAYEGFQLLAYDYDEIDDPHRTLPVGILAAVVTVTVVYVLVALGATMLVGAGTIVDQKEIALALAGEAALGTAGLVIVSIAAAFSTASAINATLFATSRLATDVADAGELPDAIAHVSSRGVPDRAVIGLAVLSAALAVVGGLSSLVEAASLVFLGTFAAVNAVAIGASERRRWVSWAGMLGAGGAGMVLAGRLVITAPIALAALAGVVLVAVVGRPWLMRRLT